MGMCEVVRCWILGSGSERFYWAYEEGGVIFVAEV